MTLCGETKSPRSSRTPRRSASPSLQRARSYSPVSITLCAAFRFSGIGSGFTPPTEGFGNRVVHLGQRRASVPRFEFDAVVIRRVVAGGDHDAAEKSSVPRGVGNRLRWGRRIREHDSEACRLERFGGRDRELARKKTAVVADDERVAFDLARRIELPGRDGNRIAYAADVVECKGVSNDGTPAV